MKKLFDKVGKKRENNLLVGKVVLVGQYSVKVEAVVGEGGFATIYRCVDMKSGQTFALKHMRLGADADAIKEVQQEAKTMARLKGHPNILKLHAVAFAGPTGAETDGFMLLDFCPLTLLEVMQRSHFNLDDYLLYEVFQDVVWAVAHMHKCSPPLAHRDLKAENVLKNSEGRWVICDFGSSTARAQVYDTPAEIAMEEDNIRRTTTPAYRAPEMWDLYSRQRIDTAVDIWALGVLLYVLAFGKLPFQGDSKLSILYGKYDMPPGRPAAMRSLIQDMLQVNPKDRPDIFQVISKLDILRNVLSGEPADAPPTPLPPTLLSPPPQQLPPAAGAHAQPHTQPHPQQLQSVPGPGGAASSGQLPYPAVPQGVYPGPPRPQSGPPPGLGFGPPPIHQQQQQQQRQQPPTVNGAGAWPNGPPAPYNSPHVPAHMQPQLHPQPPPSTPTHSQFHAPQPQPQPPHHHPPHPAPYPSPQPQGPQPHLQPHLQPGQPYGPEGAQPGPGPGSSAAAPPPRPAATPVAQRVASRQGSFNPSWPLEQQQQQQHMQRPVPHPAGAAPATAAGGAPAVPQLVNLMDAAMKDPTPSAPGPSAAAAAAAAAAAGSGATSEWKRDFHDGAGGVAGPASGAGSGLLPPARPPQEPGAAADTPLPAVGASPGSAHFHRRTGSGAELSRLQPHSSSATASSTAGAGPGAGAAGSHAAMGFGDDLVDWGDQPPAFGAGTGHHHHQRAERAASQPLLLDTLPLPASSAASAITGGGGGAGGGGADPAVLLSLPAAPQSAGFLHSNANSTSKVCSPLAVAAAAPPPSPSPSPHDGDTAAPAGAALCVQRVGSFELVSGGLADTEVLRAQLQQLTAANTHLEGRVRQLEVVVASQGSVIQRLVAELRALVNKQQQQHQHQHQHDNQHQVQHQQPPPQPLQHGQLSQSPQPQQGLYAVQQPAVVLSGGSRSGAGGGGGTSGVATSMSRSVSAGLPAATSCRDEPPPGGGGGGMGNVPASPARAVAPLEFESEPWGAPAAFGGPPAPSGGAVYPPLRYEDLT